MDAIIKAYKDERRRQAGKEGIGSKTAGGITAGSVVGLPAAGGVRQDPLNTAAKQVNQTTVVETLEECAASMTSK